MFRPKNHYAFALKRTDGGPEWVAFPRCGNDNDVCSKIEWARKAADKMLLKPGIEEVDIVLVSYSVREKRSKFR